ncbi:septation protein SepH [Actinopolymorpha alba]|uniref:septation protein SepH n=1 Tax=Actinopolymorpha alba TaxID=533267 RepID=UPI000379AEC7|nr:septation protein SepH [Actinopolymorpha alba]
MRDVKLVRLSDDGTHLVLTHEGTGEEFALRVDDRLRGAVVSDRARLGSLPLEKQSRLRPKEIQARLRAGESSEAIAAAADVPLERILRYAGPVLAEREYIAEQARRCALRRNGREGPGQTLEEAVGNRLEDLGISRELANWDAWRSPEGRWAVSVSFSLDDAPHRAVFTYDPLGRVVTTADDKARALVGEALRVPGSAPGLAPVEPPRAVGTPPVDSNGYPYAESHGTPYTEGNGMPYAEQHGTAYSEPSVAAGRDGHRLRLAPPPAPDVGTGGYIAPAVENWQRREVPASEPTPAPAPPVPGHDTGPDAEDTIDLSHAVGRSLRSAGPDAGAPRPIRTVEPDRPAAPPAPAAPTTHAAPATPAARDLAPDEVPDLDDPPLQSRVEPDRSQEHEPEPEATEPESRPDDEAADQSEPVESEPAPAPRRPRTGSSADARRRRARSGGRKGSVPSWDDILFGGGRGGQD